MAKGDYYFPLYYQKLLTSTTGWKDDEFGAYLRLLIYQYDNGAIPDDLPSISRIAPSAKKNWNLLSKKFVKAKEEGFLINTVMDELRTARQKKSENLSKNGSKGGRPKNPIQVLQLITKLKADGFQNQSNNNMVNGYLLEIINLLKEKEENIQADNQNFFLMLILKMIEVFLKENPEYFFHKETDYSACLQIAYNIAQMKHWPKADVVNGKMEDCIESWKTIVDFIKNDDWYSSRSLSDISTVKEWQRLVQSMKKPKNATDKRSNSTGGQGIGKHIDLDKA